MSKRSEALPDIVTDHALIRWMERGHGLDLSGYRDQLRELVQSMIDAGASGGYLPCGLWATIEGGRLTSVWPTRPDYHARHNLDRKRSEAAR